jgi:hypothetical protein
VSAPQWHGSLIYPDLLLTLQQASYPHPCGTTTSQRLPACSQSWTSSISSSITTGQPRMHMPQRTSKSFVSSLYEVIRRVHFLFHSPTLQFLDIEKELGVAQPPLLYEHPSSTLYDCAKLLIQSHARRLPLLDSDTETGHEVIVSVLTQYRLLKFISINVCIDCPTCCQRLIFHSATRKYNIFSSRYGNSRLVPTSPHKFRQARIHIIPLPQHAWRRPFLMLCTCFRNAPYLLFPSSTKTALL